MILIALGGNRPGKMGAPLEILQWAIVEMAKRQMNIISISSFYRTKAVGQKEQSDYINAVVRVQAAMSPANILTNLKLIEKEAGRDNQQMRISGYWGPRTLDLDLIDYKSIVSANYSVCSRYNHVTVGEKTASCRLVLPHPRAHERPFVMRPITDINPFWHHPVSGLSAVSLAERMRLKSEGQVLNKVR